MKLATHFHLVLKLKIRGTTPPLTNTGSCHALENFMSHYRIRFEVHTVADMKTWSLEPDTILSHRSVSLYPTA
jgi:hypothetical protein